MKTLKMASFITSLVIVLLGCNGNNQSQDKILLENEFYKSPQEEKYNSTYHFVSSGFYYTSLDILNNESKGSGGEVIGNSYHSFDLEQKIMSIIRKSAKTNKWEEIEFTILEENFPIPKKITKDKSIFLEVKSNDPYFDSVRKILIKDEVIVYFLNGGESMTFNDIQRIGNKTFNEIKSKVDNSLLKSKTSSQSYSNTIDEDFEYSEHWRQEAYKWTKKYLINRIGKEDGCRVTSQGLYQSNLVSYVGGSTYLVRIYCEFNCNKGSNNPSYFWVQATYTGSNRWQGKLVDQKMTH